MATIHPKPKLVNIRDDGDGGLQLTVTTHRSEFEVMDLTPELAAAWSARLSEFVARKLAARGLAEGEARLAAIRSHGGGGA
jgi:hypothetical protein